MLGFIAKSERMQCQTRCMCTLDHIGRGNAGFNARRVGHIRVNVHFPRANALRHLSDFFQVRVAHHLVVFTRIAFFDKIIRLAAGHRAIGEHVITINQINALNGTELLQCP